MLERANHIELSATDFGRFVTEVDKPAEAAPELVKLFRRESRIPHTNEPANAFAEPGRLLDHRLAPSGSV